jgi:hypothetical protein
VNKVKNHQYIVVKLQFQPKGIWPVTVPNAVVVKAQIPLSDKEHSHTFQNQASRDQMSPRAVYTNPFDPQKIRRNKLK